MTLAASPTKAKAAVARTQLEPRAQRRPAEAADDFSVQRARSEHAQLVIRLPSRHATAGARTHPLSSPADAVQAA
eukprot:68993-Prymnesium_polylepis.1